MVEGDFNEILDESEKCRGRRKSMAAMDEFRRVVSDLALIDVKPDQGWFTWSNNRRGEGLIRERLDRFLVSAG